MNRKKFLVVVDPHHDRNLALDRMVSILQQRPDEKLEMHLFVGFGGEDKSDPSIPEEVVRGREWWRELLRPLNEIGADYTAECFWTTNWQRTILGAAERYDCGSIMIAKSSVKTKGGGLTESKWSLLRNATTDVVINTSETSGPFKCVVAAVNMQTKDPHYEDLNRAILERGKVFSEVYGAEYHVVNAYRNTEDFPDRADVQKIIDIPRDHVHRDMGKPENIISKVAKKVGADLVIIGSKSRRGLSAALRRGHTSEKVIEKLPVDVLVMNLAAQET